MEKRFVEVSKQEFDNYPGEKHCAGDDRNRQYLVPTDEQPSISNEGREIADKLIEFFMENDLLERLSQGGIGTAVAESVLAEGIVTALDECLPQYARKSISTFSELVARQADMAERYSVGAVATYSSKTLLEQKLTTSGFTNRI